MYSETERENKHRGLRDEKRRNQIKGLQSTDIRREGMLQKDLCKTLQFEVTYSMYGENLNIHYTQFIDVSYYFLLFLNLHHLKMS